MTAISPLLVIDRPARLADVATFPTGPSAAPGRSVGPARPVVPIRPAPAPHLRAIEGGRSPAVRHRHRMFWLRRSVVLLLVLVTVMVGARVVGGAVALLSSPVVGPAGAAPAAAVGASPVAGLSAPVAGPSDPSTYVVRPGDTLWSIAGQVRPGADPREVVDALSARVPGGVLQPGQSLDLSDLDG